MDSSESDMETPSSPADQDAPTATPAVDPVHEPSVVPSVPPETAQVPPEPFVPNEPAPPGEPGMYWCDEEDPGIHPILGELQHGENDYTGVTHPDSLQAIGDLVAAGVLRKA